MAAGRRDTLIRSTLAALLAAFGAYASSFALDLLGGGITHFYPSIDPVPVVLWGLMSVAGVALSVGLRPDGRVVWMATAAMALFAIVAAARGHHPHNWIVVAGLVGQTALVWMATRRIAAVRTLDGA